MDKIILKDLKIATIIGVFPEERLNKQELVFNIELGCDLSRAGLSDKLEDSIDYTKVENAVLTLGEQSHFFLLEKMAEETAALCLKMHGVKSVNVRIEKSGALKHGKIVAVEIQRNK
jgi:FolB domain-containing protein